MLANPQLAMSLYTYVLGPYGDFTAGAQYAAQRAVHLDLDPLLGRLQAEAAKSFLGLSRFIMDLGGPAPFSVPHPLWKSDFVEVGSSSSAALLQNETLERRGCWELEDALKWAVDAPAEIYLQQALKERRERLDLVEAFTRHITALVR